MSLLGLVEMGSLSPVQEEEAAVIVMNNPMRAGMVDDTQLNSSGKNRNNAAARSSSNFNSSVGDGRSTSESGTGVAGSTREEERGGGQLFADAAAVAGLTSTAATVPEHTRGSGTGMVARNSKNGASRWGRYQGLSGSWGKSRSLSKERAIGPARADRPPSPSEKVVTQDVEAAGAGAGADAPPSVSPRSIEWIVSTGRSFDSKAESEGVDRLGSQSYASEIRGGGGGQEEKREVVSGSPEKVRAAGTGNVVPVVDSAEAKINLPEEVGQGVVTAKNGSGLDVAPTGVQLETPSTLVVDGNSPQVFEQAELVAERLREVVEGRGAVLNPEDDVPKHAGPGTKSGGKEPELKGDWRFHLTGRDPKVEAAENDGANAAGDDNPLPQALPPAGAVVEEGVRQKGAPPSIGLALTPEKTSDNIALGAPPKALYALPTKATVEIPAPGKADARRVVESEKISLAQPEEHRTPVLHLLPKAQVGTPYRSAKPAPSPRSTPPARPSLLPQSGTPDGGSRVSQVVEVFERLTPRGRPGRGTPGGGGFTPRVTPPKVTPPKRGASSTSFTSVRSVVSSTTGGASWSTPNATPDRPGLSVTRATTPDQISIRFDSALEEQARGSAAAAPPSPGGPTRTWATPLPTPDQFRTTGSRSVAPEERASSGGSSRAWTPPAATPDRFTKMSAPDSGSGGANPELTTIFNGAPGAKNLESARVSSVGHRKFAWPPEPSSAGVDGLVLSLSSEFSDSSDIAAEEKVGGALPRIVESADIRAAVKATPVVTPTIEGGTTSYHQLSSTISRPPGRGRGATDARGSAQQSFGTPQVAAFVADAQAEAAAEAAAEAQVADEEAHAAEREAQLAQQRARVAAEKSRAAAAASSAVSTAVAGSPPTFQMKAEKERPDIQSHFTTNPDIKLWAGEPGSLEAVGSRNARSGAVGEAEGKVEAIFDPYADDEGEVGMLPEMSLKPVGSFNEPLEEGGLLTTAATTKEAVSRGGSGGEPVEADTTDDGAATKEKPEQEESVGSGPGKLEQRGQEQIAEKNAQPAKGEGEKTTLPGKTAEVAALRPKAISRRREGVNLVEDAPHKLGTDDNNGGGKPGSSPRGRARDFACRDDFGSSKSILNWNEGDSMEEGDAERDAAEVKALVAEAMALVMEASTDA